ncbi:MAG: hypothetical protein AB7O88_01845 [Reyranellaceae bacterium]
MRLLPAILTLMALLAPVQAQMLNERESQAERIGGRWLGRYYYSGQQADRPPVEFELTLEVPAAGQVTGRMSEPNTFGKPGVPFLYAHVRGEIVDNHLRFIKTYDGTGGQTHSVAYSGTFNASWTTMVGTWRINDTTGRFDLRR